MDTFKCMATTTNQWQILLEILDALGSRYLYRGQCNSNWHLSTRLERDLDLIQVAPQSRKLHENETLDRFSRRARFYTGYELRDALEWLALLQHHGGPTRLFDITGSMFVAMFFALDGAHDDVALWAFHENGIKLGADRVLNEDYGRYADPEYRIETSKRANRFISQRSVWKLAEYPDAGDIEEPDQSATVLVVEPEMLFDRIAVQQGLFLFPTNLQRSFETNLANTFGWEQLNPEEVAASDFLHVAKNTRDFEIGVVKIVIERTALPAVARNLHAMNVNAASIYPGLDGFAKSLSPIFSPKQ